MKFASQSGKLSPDLLKQLGIAGGMSSPNVTDGAIASKKKKNENDAETNKLEAAESPAKDPATK
jgi:hypothetical protein